MPATTHDDPVSVGRPAVYGRSRFRVGDPLPLVLTSAEVGGILDYGAARTSQLKKVGAFDLFEILPRIGPSARYSGKKVQQWLDGGLEAPKSSHFGIGSRRR